MMAGIRGVQKVVTVNSSIPRNPALLPYLETWEKKCLLALSTAF